MSTSHLYTAHENILTGLHTQNAHKHNIIYHLLDLESSEKVHVTAISFHYRQHV